MSDEQLFVIQIYESGRWVNTKWTHGPVQKRAITKALQRAICKFPGEEYRIKEVGRAK